jgi:hypothetical protein
METRASCAEAFAAERAGAGEREEPPEFGAGEGTAAATANVAAPTEEDSEAAAAKTGARVEEMAGTGAGEGAVERLLTALHLQRKILKLLLNGDRSIRRQRKARLMIPQHHAAAAANFLLQFGASCLRPFCLSSPQKSCIESCAAACQG